MDLGLQGKVALVLAASKGLGRASASALSYEGAAVTIGARHGEMLAQTAQEIEKDSGNRVLAVPCDVTRPEDLDAIVTATVQEFGRLDILVNNAGGPPFGYFANFDDSAWQKAFELNLLSAVRLIRLVLPHMRQVRGGRIINIVGTSVKQSIDGLLLSNTIRPGVIGLAKSLSIELGSDNITINNVCPGRILTDRILESLTVREKLARGMSVAEATSDQAEDIPLRRIGKPEELGALVAFLASSQASYISGTTIAVDGGLLRSVL